MIVLGCEDENFNTNISTFKMQTKCKYVKCANNAHYCSSTDSDGATKGGHCIVIIF